MVLGEELKKARAAQDGHGSTGIVRLGRGTATGIPLPVTGRNPEGYVWTDPRPPRGSIDRPFLEQPAPAINTAPGQAA
jgi:hypothetical protein